jgi:hypothetical protein
MGGHGAVLDFPEVFRRASDAFRSARYDEPRPKRSFPGLRRSPKAAQPGPPPSRARRRFPRLRGRPYASACQTYRASCRCLALSVAGLIEPTMLDAAIRRASKRPTENMGSYDLCLSRTDGVLASVGTLAPRDRPGSRLWTGAGGGGRLTCHSLAQNLVERPGGRPRTGHRADAAGPSGLGRRCDGAGDRCSRQHSTWPSLHRRFDSWLIDTLVWSGGAPA